MTRSGEVAARLHANGWCGLLPLVPGGKRPAITEWQRFNRGQTDAELAELRFEPGSGIGAAAGNGVVYFDLDILDQAAVSRAVILIEEICEPTPIHRIGRPPKRVLAYRNDDALSCKYPHGLPVEVFGGGPGATGQVVLYGVHPDTGKPYFYPHRTPANTRVARLPEVTSEHVEVVIETLAADPLVSACQRAQRGPGGARTVGLAGITVDAAARARETPGGAAAWLGDMTPGGRHAAAVAAVAAVLKAGLDAKTEAAELDAIEAAFRRVKPEAEPSEWRGVLAWAQQCAPRRRRADLLKKLGAVTHD